MLAGRLHNSLFELNLLSNVRANGTRLLVAVSGGLDSVVLLHLLAGLASKLQLELSVAHIDHGLRTASARDAEFVARLADQLGLPFLLATLGARPRGENLEAWAREERYTAVERLRRQSESQLIVTAHHRDDLVETLLFRAMSNRLTTSLATMEGYDAERKLLRPLLAMGRAELLAYAEINGLTWVEDESNADLARSRNLLRHQIIPQLQQ